MKPLSQIVVDIDGSRYTLSPSGFISFDGGPQNTREYTVMAAMNKAYPPLKADDVPPTEQFEVVTTQDRENAHKAAWDAFYRQYQTQMIRAWRLGKEKRPSRYDGRVILDVELFKSEIARIVLRYGSLLETITNTYNKW